MNILVTGGEGFIGKKLVNRLIKEKHNVISLDKTNSADIIADLSDENFNFDCVDNIDYIFHSVECIVFNIQYIYIYTKF